jgi:curved DNA-binding protein CbpA
MAAAAPAVKTCLYVVLGVERDVDADALKKAFRKAALRWHPDKVSCGGEDSARQAARHVGVCVRSLLTLASLAPGSSALPQNPDNAEEASTRFKEIRSAYEVLSDPHERAWYDSHRDTILRGHRPGAGGKAGGADEPETDPDGLNLFQYFSSSCYNDYSDTAPDGFYTVYASIFERLDGLEMAAQKDAGLSESRAPPFGTSSSEMREVRAFYSHWVNFISGRTFSFRDKWNLADATNRQIRRAMEKENKEARQAAKKEYNENVRNLVRFVKKRDKRVMAYEQKEKLEELQKAVNDTRHMACLRMQRRCGAVLACVLSVAMLILASLVVVSSLSTKRRPPRPSPLRRSEPSALNTPVSSLSVLRSRLEFVASATARSMRPRSPSVVREPNPRSSSSASCVTRRSSRRSSTRITSRAMRTSSPSRENRHSSTT